ncbi:MAG: Uma2 family endonuclease [Chloroflexi bacterium]|nr:Uma2 family endonuclease [Chloroflexota bacterium]
MWWRTDITLHVKLETKAKLTYEDYANLPGDDRYELIDGELILVPSPSEFHQAILMNLIHLLQSVRQSGLERLYCAPFDVIFTDHDVAQPNLLFIAADRADIITAANVRGAPDLVVEILSPSTSRLDRTRKRELYERHGVKEMWLVDPRERKLAVLLLRDGKLEDAGEYGTGQALVSETLGNLTIDLDDVFQGKLARG